MNSQKYKILLLDSDKPHKGNLGLMQEKGSKFLFNYDNTYCKLKEDTYFPKHLIVISDEEIKSNNYIGDWCYSKTLNKILMSTSNIEAGNNEYYKVIASTNPDLKLPLIPESYISHFIEEYNKGNILTEIKLEVEWYTIENQKVDEKHDVDDYCIIKTTSTNEVIPVINSKERLYTREELVDIIFDFNYKNGPNNKEGIKQWLKENLK
jgi:hypothetical protein